MVTCPKGHPNPEGYYFCEECGTPIAAPVAASTETKGALESSYPPSLTDRYRQLTQPNWGPFVIVGGIAALIVGVLAVFAAQTSGNDGGSRSGSTPTAQPTWGSQSPGYTYTTTTTRPPVLPTPEQFKLDVVIVEKDCFGSAGCNVMYDIDPSYTGPESLLGTSFTVVYQIDGGREPQTGNFTVTNGKTIGHRYLIDTPSASSTLAAVATKVLPY